MYIQTGLFWGVIITIVIVLLIIYYSLKKQIKKQTTVLAESDMKRTYQLRFWLTRKTTDLPLVKEVFNKHKKDSHSLYSKNGLIDLTFLGGECRWFVNGHFVPDEAEHGKSKTLFYEQIAGEKNGEENGYRSPAVFFIINQRWNDKKGLYLSADLLWAEYTEKNNYWPQKEKLIHLGEFPIPKYYEEWDEANFERIKKWGWKDVRNDDLVDSYNDIFGETCYYSNDLEYEKEDGLIKISFI